MLLGNPLLWEANWYSQQAARLAAGPAELLQAIRAPTEPAAAAEVAQHVVSRLLEHPDGLRQLLGPGQAERSQVCRPLLHRRCLLWWHLAQAVDQPSHHTQALSRVQATKTVPQLHLQARRLLRGLSALLQTHPCCTQCPLVPM